MLLSKIKITSPDNLVSRLSSALDVRVEVVRCQANQTDGGTSILRIESGTDVKVEDIKKWFSGSDDCTLISFVSISKGRYMVTVRNAQCRLCKAFIGSDCFLESACTTSVGSIVWRVFAPNNLSLKDLIQRLRAEDCKVELLSLKRAVSNFELTQVQDEAIRLAYSLGYYDIPKKVTLEELAERSGVSKATLNLILRRGQRKIISERLGNSTDGLG